MQCLLSLVFVIISVGVAFGTSNVGNITTIFEGLTPPYFCIRVPGAVRSSSGAILVFAEARRGDNCADQNPKDVVLSVSNDNGRSWSPLRRIVGDGSGNFTYRNPYPVFSASGALILNFVNTTAPVWESFQIVSLDEGVTWSAPASLASDLGPWNGILDGPGFGIQLGLNAKGSPYAGRLLSCGATMYNPGGGSLRGSNALLSDDGGSQWAAAAPPPGPFTGSLSECQVAELPNASILINFRREAAHPCRCRAQARSDDGGQTWTLPVDVPELLEPVCSGGLLATASGKVFFSNPSSATARVNMTLRRSDDGGSSWPAGNAQVIWPGPSAYSVLIPPLPADPLGAIGVVYENGDQEYAERISFAPVTL